MLPCLRQEAVNAKAGNPWFPSLNLLSFVYGAGTRSVVVPAKSLPWNVLVQGRNPF